MSVAYRIVLDGAQEVPAVTTAAGGRGYAIFDTATNSLFYSLAIFGLDFGAWLGESAQTAATADDITDAHFHPGATGVEGGPIFGLKSDLDDFTVSPLAANGSRSVSGRWETTDAPSLTPFLATFSGTGVTLGGEIPVYINFHTTANPGGEIRGQMILIATDASETVSGTDGDDVLPGLGGDDIINAGAGADILIGGAGDDTLNGGAGVDTASYEGAGAGVTVDLSNASAQNTGGAGVDAFVAIENLIGSAFDDMLSGDGLANTLSGLSGSDVLNGGDFSADTMLGGAGDDIYIVDHGGDVIIELAGEGIDLVRSDRSWTLGDNVENLTAFFGVAIVGTGNALDNVIEGSGTLNGLGGPGYASVSADYDGDGKADPAVYHELTGRWIILPSTANYSVAVILSQTLGGPGYSGMPADYDGDRLADPGVYQRERGDWKVLLSSAGYYPVELSGFLGGTGYRAVAADYDGDKLADPAIYGESNGVWAFKLSSANYVTFAMMQTLGGTGYIPVPADYDGDGLADPAVKSETGNEWIVMFSSGNYTTVPLTILFE